ncbi:hypothetical protein CEXT_37331 [Caerostris extrusa]|uniref:Huntingtin n=1 Tax=Caerostris extrusa TaxID=172846 RepID=A0AAV4RVY3_CAEEX|nr:hypothetical protein CEXT_37331 [Caerostris extrusa]
MDSETKFGFPASQAANYSVNDCRSLVKTIICGVKSVAWAIQLCKVPGDVYGLAPPVPGQAPSRQMAANSIRSKDEKKNHRISYAELSWLILSLLMKTSSHIFATILVEYLLKRMEEMGTESSKCTSLLTWKDQTCTYGLFKMVFGCVSLFAAANEEMLKIVNRSMELALSAKEPYNYFLLLRALFRSIGGGSHDLLYQEFLPLLPNLLQGKFLVLVL